MSACTGSVYKANHLHIPQGGDFSAFSNAFQSTPQPVPPHYAQPYPQAAGVCAPQQAAARPVQAKPLTQPHKPLQQIPFMPQCSTATQSAVKPKLFVPNQAQPQHAAPTADDIVNASSPFKAAKPIVTGSTQLASNRPAVSSRLSALKAKLDQEKHRIAEDKSRDMLGCVACWTCMHVSYASRECMVSELS